MRIRNVKNKEEILSSCEKLIKNPKEYIGKWHGPSKLETRPHSFD